MKQKLELTNKHLLITGSTGSGKTHALKYFLTRTQGDIVVLDPHASPNDWPNNCKVRGAGRDFNTIQRCLELSRQELNNRYQQRSQGQTQFTPLILAIDEIPAICSEIKQASQILSQIAREGRKISMYLYLSTQSDRVKTLGIAGEGDVRDNFTKISIPNTPHNQKTNYKIATVTTGETTTKIRIPKRLPAQTTQATPQNNHQENTQSTPERTTQQVKIPTPIDTWEYWTPKGTQYRLLKRAWQVFSTLCSTGPYLLLKAAEYQMNKKGNTK